MLIIKHKNNHKTYQNGVKKWNLDSVERMNKLLHSLQKELPLCEIVSVDGLKLKEDGLHFNSASCRELGIRYFEKFKKFAL